jgi:hypothetical protein
MIPRARTACGAKLEDQLLHDRVILGVHARMESGSGDPTKGL